MTGNEWVGLTENQKFHAVFNELFSLDQKGYTILECEYFYINAPEEFYTSAATMGTLVNEALASIGAMSNSITK